MLSAGARPSSQTQSIAVRLRGLFDASDFRAERMIIGMNKWR